MLIGPYLVRRSGPLPGIGLEVRVGVHDWYHSTSLRRKV